MPISKLQHVSARTKHERDADGNLKVWVEVRFKRELLAPHKVVNPSTECLCTLCDLVSARSFSRDGWVDVTVNGWHYVAPVRSERGPHHGGL